MKLTPKRWYRHLTIILLVLLAVVLVMSTVGFTIKFLYLGRNDNKMRKLEQALMDLRAGMNADSVRQFNIQKIMKIIDSYNKDLPSGKKYEIANEIYAMSQKYTNLDVDFLCATITEETAASWDPKMTSKTGAMGLMQIMPATGMFLAKSEDIAWTSAEEILLDPIYNIRLGARYLSVLIDLYGVDGGLAAYNSGEKHAALWLANNKAEGLLQEETKNYIPSVLELYEKYQNLKL